MTDLEIEQYLNKNEWAVDSHDAIMKVFNTSPQIAIKKYDFNNSMITIMTPDNSFTFKWILRKL